MVSAGQNVLPDGCLLPGRNRSYSFRLGCGRSYRLSTPISTAAAARPLLQVRAVQEIALREVRRFGEARHIRTWRNCCASTVVTNRLAQAVSQGVLCET
jgi:hypothetical protein